MARLIHFIAILGAVVAPLTRWIASAASPSLSDSFRVGRGGEMLCRAQNRARAPAIQRDFDRAWSLVCRDAAKPIGMIRALRGGNVDIRLAELRTTTATCGSTTAAASLGGLAGVAVRNCILGEAPVGSVVYSIRRGPVTYVAEGLAGYASALELGRRTIVADKIVSGKVTVAPTSVANPIAFARVQAGTLQPDQAMAEGYRRNNSGDHAEASEFFDTLQQRSRGEVTSERTSESLINRGLQKSHIGDFDEANSLFSQARAAPTADRVQTRLRHNFEALHLLNQQRHEDALARLDLPVAQIDGSNQSERGIEIGASIAVEITSGVPVAQRLSANESTSLTPGERALILDARATQIRGTLLRLEGKPSAACVALTAAAADALAMRQGRVLSITRLHSQILAETGLALDELGDISGVEAKMREAFTLLENRYPQTIAVNGARARLAANLTCHGQADAALGRFRQVVQTAPQEQSSVTGLGNLLNPYFGLLVDRMGANPALADDLFLATQTLVRPGVADTQAILARELSEGAGPGSRLFRQARTLERDIERTRIELANLVAAPNQSPEVRQAIATLNIDLQQYGTGQIIPQSELATYPQFRALTPDALTLAELKTVLKPGEAYLKLVIAGSSVGQALAATQRKLMDDKKTSQPYYWVGFAVVGDSAQKLVAAHEG